MADAWTCPACGARNAMDAAECGQCGRWASIFDLERRDAEVAVATEPARAQAPEPEPVILAEPHSSTAERARSVFDLLRDAAVGGTEAEPTQPGAGRVLRWIVIGLAVLWFVLVPLLDQLL